MKASLALWHGLFTLTSAATQSIPSASIPSSNTTYHGLFRDSVEYFLSIRYALDTSGQHRFQPPRAFHPPDNTIISATSYFPACPQQLGAQNIPFYLGNITAISEDCLFLNIARPNGTKPGDNLPVLVHIHGGSFISSSKDEPVVQPGGLILESQANGNQPVMQVNINYRLGVFGFAKSPSLQHEGSLNAALKDQYLALQWVQSNIFHFGGDPTRITITGQSSGGLAVGMQILAYGGSQPPLFQRAVAESTVLEPGITGNFTTQAMTALVANTTCADASNDAATITCLRTLSLDDLLNAQLTTASDAYSSNGGDQWLPTVDADILPLAPSTLLAQARFHNISTIMGWCDGDSNDFVDDGINTPADTHAAISAYLPSVSPQHITHLLSLYPETDFHADPAANISRETYRCARIQRDILFTCPPLLFSRALQKSGNAVYLFDQNQTVLDPIFTDVYDQPGLGVVHTSEFAYVYGNLSHYNVYDYPYHPRAIDLELVPRVSRAWASFARAGAPSAQVGALEGWGEAFAGPEKDDVKVFVIGGAREGYFNASDHANPALEEQRLVERCGFLNSPEIVKELGY